MTGRQEDDDEPDSVLWDADEHYSDIWPHAESGSGEFAAAEFPNGTNHNSSPSPSGPQHFGEFDNDSSSSWHGKSRNRQRSEDPGPSVSEAKWLCLKCGSAEYYETGYDGEDAEGTPSESKMTDDPEIDPDTMETLPKLSRRQKKNSKKPSNQKPVSNAAAPPSLRPVPEHQQLATGRDPDPPDGDDEPPDGDGDEHTPRRKSKPKKVEKPDKYADWTSSHGPKPGLKFRGGTPPAPPVWSYTKDDLRSFNKWERKVTVWREQIRSYLPDREAALMLYCSLKGEAEEELEFADIRQINSKGGVDYIIEALRKPLMTKTIYTSSEDTFLTMSKFGVSTTSRFGLTATDMLVSNVRL
ncbi:Pentatricopeptide repeat-containing protein [Durusdinium trenchii]|uniref:Mitochondrial n=1 Tax=Durusdinium trenchii TaxID=1381693 RepID=A0ABP0LTP8_9DINO